METKHLILIAAWLVYIAVIEICFHVYENYESNIRIRSRKRRKFTETAKWTGIISTAVIAAFTVKQILS